MKTAIITRLIAVAVLSMLSACTYVKTLFPDKEKDYQYTTEIPPMILPADLKANYIPSLPASAPSDSDVSVATPQAAVKAVASAPVANKPAASPSTPVEAAQAAPAANNPAPPMPVEATVSGPTASKPAPVSSGAVKDVGFESEPEESTEAVTVERVRFDKGENRLHINVPFITAWRMTGKALSRKFIEVTARNQEAGLFTVRYDPEEHTVKEPSYLDAVTSLFSDDTHGNEKTYLIKLEKNNQQIDVVIVDKDQQLLSDPASFKLLTLLQETMKADLAHKAASANKSPKE